MHNAQATAGQWVSVMEYPLILNEIQKYRQVIKIRQSFQQIDTSPPPPPPRPSGRQQQGTAPQQQLLEELALVAAPKRRRTSAVRTRSNNSNAYVEFCGLPSVIFQGLLAGWTALNGLFWVYGVSQLTLANMHDRTREGREATSLAIMMGSTCNFTFWLIFAFPLLFGAIISLKKH